MSVQLAGLDVSRETILELEHYVALVRKWTQRINLVAPGSIGDIWDRHIVDSAQILKFAPPTLQHWVDLGSGAGFPGIVAATLAKAIHPDVVFTLIESDQRKSAFLRTVARELALPVTVLASRIDVVPPQNADVVSARALSDLGALIPHIVRHLRVDGIALLHKGRRYADEVAEARRMWSFELEEYPSITDPDARLLAIQRISRA